MYEALEELDLEAIERKSYGVLLTKQACQTVIAYETRGDFNCERVLKRKIDWEALFIFLNLVSLRC